MFGPGGDQRGGSGGPLRDGWGPRRPQSETPEASPCHVRAASCADGPWAARGDPERGRVPPRLHALHCTEQDCGWLETSRRCRDTLTQTLQISHRLSESPPTVHPATRRPVVLRLLYVSVTTRGRWVDVVRTPGPEMAGRTGTQFRALSTTLRHCRGVGDGRDRTPGGRPQRAQQMPLAPIRTY